MSEKIQVGEADAERLTELARHEGRPETEILREAIEAYARTRQEAQEVDEAAFDRGHA